MPRTFRTALIGAGLLFVLVSGVLSQTVPPPEDTPADDRPPEVVLDAKGLYRVGNTYVLNDQPVRDTKLQQFAAEAEALELQFRPLLDEHARLKRESHAPGKASQRNQAKAVLRDFELFNKADLDRYEAEKERVTNGMQLLVGETRKLYESLWSDPTVKRAIRAYNREHRPKIVLGPVANAEAYRAAILRDDAVLLREKGMIPEKGHRWVVELEARVGSLAFQAHNRLEQHVAAAAAVEAGTPSKLSEKRRAIAERLATAPESESRPLAAEVRLLDTQLQRLAPESPGMVAAWGERANHLAKTRGAFLAAVAELRRTADAAPDARRQLESDVEALDALEELAGKAAGRPANRAHHVAEALEYRRGLATLAELEAAIRVERLRMDAEGKGPRLVAVTLNGSHAVRAAIVPGVATTRLPAVLASTLGATPGPGAVSVDVPLPGGQTVQGRVGVLRSVAVGPVSVEHVPCVVLTADAPGPHWPVLGADLLDMIGGVTDSRGVILIITRVVPVPHKDRAAAPAPASAVSP